MTDPLAPTPTLAEQLLAHLRGHQKEWRDRYHLQRIGLFGSTARNEAMVNSDVDVCVNKNSKMTYMPGYNSASTKSESR